MPIPSEYLSQGERAGECHRDTERRRESATIRQTTWANKMKKVKRTFIGVGLDDATDGRISRKEGSGPSSDRDRSMIDATKAGRKNAMEGRIAREMLRQRRTVSGRTCRGTNKNNGLGGEG